MNNNAIPEIPKSWDIKKLTSRPRARNINAKPNGYMTTGSRNNDLASVLGFLRSKHGLNEEQLFEKGKAINDSSVEPMSEDEVSRIVHSIASYDANSKVGTQDIPISRSIAMRMQGKVCFVPEFGWMIYRDGIFQVDTNGTRTREFVKRQLEQLSDGLKSTGDPDHIKAARRLLSASKVNSVLTLIQSDDELLMEICDFDVMPDLLNLQNGTLDLTTFELCDHNPENKLTKKANVAYDELAQCPSFEKLMDEVLPREHQEFVMRYFGYSLLGRPSEQVFLILFGKGANGKSTLLNIVEYILGNYAAHVDPSSIIKQKNSGIRNDLARLNGVHLTVTSELAIGQILDAPMVKQFTGGDLITARFLYKEPIEFKPKFSLVMGTNVLPVIDGSDAALARRVLLVPFSTIIPEERRDPKLGEKLEEEASGILNALLKGLRQYKEIGLAVPDDLKRERDGYVASSDLIENFLADEFEFVVDASVRASELYLSYSIWSGSNGLGKMSQPQFRQELFKKGHTQKRSKQGSSWVGMRRRKLEI